MTNIDQFESVFRAADKPRFVLQDIRLDRILVVTDVSRAAAESFRAEAQVLCSEVATRHQPEWSILTENDYAGVDGLITAIRDGRPDLICTYRNLQMPATAYPYSLGAHVDIMTQATEVPVLLLPRPDLEPRHVPDNVDSVMVITDHLTGEDRLVSVAVHLTEPGGRLWLSHMEDEAQLQRFLDIISKIPSLDTETAIHTIKEQLLKEPRDYIASCRDVLQQSGHGLQVEAIVTMGHYLRDYRRLIEDHQVDLLVFNTKDDDQLAMHGMAYPLAVELRNTPLLLL